MTSSNPPQDKMIYKCPKQAAIVSEKLLSFYKENELFDTVLIVGSNCINIQAHRVVLCAFSEYFLEKFRGGQNALQTSTLQLKEIEASNLKLIIDFMYTGLIELRLANIDGLLKTALFLKIKTLIEGCYELIGQNINSSNSLTFLRLANELSLSSLKAKSLECIYTHFEKISKANEFLLLNKDELKNLLFNDNPHNDFQEVVFLSMVDWINYDKLNRAHFAFELLSMIRFRALSPKFILENRKSVCKTVEDYELICSWLQWHLSPDTRSNLQPNRPLIPRKKTDKLAVIGHQNGREICFQTFNSKENTWSMEMKKLSPSIRSNSSTIVIDNKLLEVGGYLNGSMTNRIQCLDMGTIDWVDFPPMNTPRMDCQLANLNRYLCVFGLNTNFVPSMEIYNFSSCKWNRLQPMGKLSKYSRITALNGRLYILDFENGFLQVYDISSNKWTSKAVGKSSLRNFGFAGTERFLYVIGGNENGEYMKTVKRYDLSNNSWCELASLSRGLEHPTTKVFGNKIMICDGCNVEEYNIDIDKWNTLSCLPEEVKSISVSISNTVFNYIISCY
ncbi:kelch-like protein 4 [Episyrphus balteatus]|uniref:kelch-like protein 4 n=1 Tax=Episyrphus balteatus TaxID=286459 RepID=UPI0024867807|nr:kelch-like protein 4 [Episyrphus balteatus]